MGGGDVVERTCADCGLPASDPAHAPAGHEFVPVWDDAEPHVVGGTEVEFGGMTHICVDPECHVPGFVESLRRAGLA